MRSASRAPRSARHQPAPAVTHGFAEGRSGYSDNSTARTAHFGAVKTTIGDPEGIAPFGPRSLTFAPCGVLFPPLDKYAAVASRPTGASVAYLLGVPPAVGTSRGYAARVRRGNSRQPTQSSFRVSGFPQGAERP